ncbi:uncharacterized protein TrAtP1_008146 [Trichoderma atroviride]|uniref:uncharacterized protein n=1 Tax=Hypocrea atroviridis TaxID=63577 RepID=UPI0033269F9B|nr:hypothetical protein TrAtP1_008146 [Trichoderma atroviride]
MEAKAPAMSFPNLPGLGKQSKKHLANSLIDGLYLHAKWLAEKATSAGRYCVKGDALHGPSRPAVP